MDFSCCETDFYDNFAWDIVPFFLDEGLDII